MNSRLGLVKARGHAIMNRRLRIYLARSGSLFFFFDSFATLT